MPVVLDQFVQQVVTAGLMSTEEIEALVEGIPADKKPPDSEQLARELVRQKKLTAYQAKEIYSGRGKSLVLGNYVILDKLGQGGMGLVLKAEHRRMERLVALKVLSPKVVRNADSLRRFQREVKAAARLAHPNIVTAHDADEAGGTHFLVMEYVEGSDLSALVKQQGPLPLDQALDCILQAAAGLQYAHEHGVVHRDIKPANLLLDHRGSVKILDMGLARLDTAGDRQDELTGSGQIMGTVDYMAPEQATSTKHADGRADIYSLGVTLWYLLTGQPLYTGETAVEKLIAHQSQPIPSLCAVCPDVSPALEAVFRRMVAKTPEERYQTMAEAIADLEPFRGGVAAAAARPAAVEDEKLDAFLRGVGSAPTSHRHAASSSGPSRTETRPAKAEPKAPPGAAAVAGVEPTLDWSGAQVDTNTRTEQTLRGGALPKPPTRKRPHPPQSPWWQDWKKLAACAVPAVVLLVVAVLLLRPERSPSDKPDGEKQNAVAPAAPQAETQPEPARLVLRWPPPERTNAQLQIDGRVHDPAELVDPNAQDQLSITLKPGAHRVWIARRGFEPFEQTVSLKEGEKATLTPGWRAATVPQSVQESNVAEAAKAEPAPMKAAPADPAAVVADILPETKPISPSGKAEPSASSETSTPGVPALKAALAEMERLLAQQEPLEVKYGTAVRPIDTLVAAWDFAAAATALEQVHLDEPELAARLARRCEEIARFAALKTRMIQQIKAAQPPLTKHDLGLRGLGGDIVGADESGIGTRLASGKQETLAWGDLGSHATEKLLALVTNTEEKEDWLSAALFAHALGDAASGRRLLKEAQARGASLADHLTSVAAAELDGVVRLVRDGQYGPAATALQSLRTTSAGLDWYAAHRELIEAADAAVAAGLREQEAEKLYTQAAGHFAKQALFDVRPLVDKLRAEYADTAVMLDSGRKPSFAELERAVTDLGKMFTVRQDGKGDFKSIQAAIDAAPANSLIEIQDNGPYGEQITVPKEKAGLTIRGEQHILPVVTLGSKAIVTGLNLFSVEAPSTTLERLVLLHTAPAGQQVHCLGVAGQEFSLRGSMVVMVGSGWSVHMAKAQKAAFDRSLIVGGAVEASESLATFTNCALRVRMVYGRPSVHVRSCTVIGELASWGGPPATPIDSIVQTVISGRGGTGENSNVFKGTLPQGLKNSFSADPRFRDPTNLDYRLQPGSPCIGKASDGGDIGCRYTPEMIELCKIALELRNRGVIKF